MASRPRIPLRDLPLDQFVAPVPESKKQKRPLSPSRPALYNPTKRRILDEAGISASCSFGTRPASSSLYDTQFATPMRPSRPRDMHSLLDSPPSSHPRLVCSKLLPDTRTPALDPGPTAATTPLPSRHSLLPWDPHATPTIHLHSCSQQSSVDRQSKHYPGFDVYHDNHTAAAETADVQLSFVDVILEEEGCKENVAPKRKTKISVKNRLSTGSQTSSRLRTPPRISDTDCSWSSSSALRGISTFHFGVSHWKEGRR